MLLAIVCSTKHLPFVCNVDRKQSPTIAAHIGRPVYAFACPARSSDIYPNEKAGNFSEIDVEWLNGNPAREPGSLWFNAFTE
jgi:hypothetical protein